MRRSILSVLLLIALPIALIAQRARGASDPTVDNGSRLYAANCYRCHGDGDQVAGVDLRKGRFRRAGTDAELAGVIRTGIPGTAMPPHSFTNFEMAGVVAYLHSLHEDNSPNTGDARAGKALFEGKGACGQCHRVNGKGSRVALDLSDVGASRSVAFLQRALVEPNAALTAQNRFIRAVRQNGTTITGRRLNEDTESVQLIDEKENLVSLQKSELRSYAVLTDSPMPSYRDKFTPKEMADVVAYLVSLKGASAR